LLVYVAPQATSLLGIFVDLCGGIVIELCCAWGNTLYCVLLLIYEGPQTTHFAGYCCGLLEVSGDTLYWASLGLMWAAFINNSRNVEVSVYLLLPSQVKSHGTASLFPN
jgi:hypothetical protein